MGEELGKYMYWQRKLFFFTRFKNNSKNIYV